MLFYQFGDFTIEEDPEDIILKGMFLSAHKIVSDIETNVPRERVLMLVDETLDPNLAQVRKALFIVNEYGMENF